MLFKVALAIWFGCLALGAWAVDPIHLVTEEWPPYSVSLNGITTGSDIEVLRVVAKEAGVEFRFDFVPWSRALDMVKSGKADGIFSLYDLPERRTYLEFLPTQLGTEELVLIVRSDTPPPGPLKSLKDLTGLTVGVLMDNTHGAAFDAATNFRREISLTTEQGLQKLNGGRMDAQVLNKANFLTTVSQTPEFQGKFKIAPLVVNSEALFLAFSKEALKARALPVSRIAASLAKLRSNGTVKAIEEKFFKP